MDYRIARGLASVAVVTTLSACLPPKTTPPPRPVTPEDGPKGTLTVEVFGGNFARQIQPSFRLDRAGYVLVGHLGGDGQIRVLYPETPQKSGWVSGGKTVRLKSHFAVWDVSPNLYSLATSPNRSFSAQMASYDGRGHGYVFLITSRYPIDYEALMGPDGFEESAVTDYDHNFDPRYAVRSFADDLTVGPYTLKFARNQHGSAYASAGCPSRWGLFAYRGFDWFPWMDLAYSSFLYPGTWAVGSMEMWRQYGFSTCRGAPLYASSRFYRTYVTPFIPVTTTPTGPLTPRLQRPTRRTLEDGERIRILTGAKGIDRTTDRSGERLAHRRPTGGSDRYGMGRFGGRERTIERTNRAREHQTPRSTTTEISGGRGSAPRPTETPRVNTPSSTPQTTTTKSTGGETRAERPRPNQ